jgi:hypothetical protein
MELENHHCIYEQQEFSLLYTLSSVIIIKNNFPDLIHDVHFPTPQYSRHNPPARPHRVVYKNEQLFAKLLDLLPWPVPLCSRMMKVSRR